LNKLKDKQEHILEIAVSHNKDFEKLAERAMEKNAILISLLVKNGIPIPEGCNMSVNLDVNNNNFYEQHFGKK